MTTVSRRKFLQYGAGVIGAAALVPGSLATSPRRALLASSSKTGFSYELWSYDNPSGVKTFQQMVAAYNATADVPVSFKISTLAGSGATVYPAKIQSLISSGNPPDLFLDWIGTLASPFVDEGAVQPLTPWFEKYGWNKILLSSAIKYVTFNGHPYEVPLAVNTLPVWYYKPAFKKAGARVPTTYLEWESANNSLLKAGYIPAAEAVIDGWDIMRLFEQLLEMTAGPTLHDHLLNRQASWNNSAVVDAFSLLQEWGNKWVEKGALGTNPNDTQLLFTSGKAAQSIQGPWYVSNLNPGTDADYDIFVPPSEHGPASRIGGFAQGYLVSSHVKGAKFDSLGAFFDWFIQPKQSRKYFYDGGTATVDGVPTNSALAVKALHISETTGGYLIQDEALGQSLINSYYTVQDGVLAGSMSPKTAAIKMANFVHKAG